MGASRLSRRAGGRLHVRRFRAGIRVAAAGAGGQAAAGVQTATCAIAVRVVMARRAAGNAWQLLVLRSRCRWRSMTIRRLPRARTMSRWKAPALGTGTLAVDAPDRTLASVAPRAAENEISS